MHWNGDYWAKVAEQCNDPEWWAKASKAKKNCWKRWLAAARRPRTATELEIEF